MTLQDFISAIQDWVITEENSFATKLHSFTTSLNKLVKSSEPPLNLHETIHNWLMTKENFSHACALLVIAYTKEITSRATSYHAQISNDSTPQLFVSWDTAYIKRLSLLNAYATYFLCKLNESSTTQTFTEQDLQLTVDLSNGDFNV